MDNDEPLLSGGDSCVFTKLHICNPNINEGPGHARLGREPDGAVSNQALGGAQGSRI